MQIHSVYRWRLSSKKWEMSRRKSLLHKFAQNCHCSRMLGFVSLVYHICFSKKICGAANSKPSFSPKALWLFQRRSVNLEACLKQSKRHTFTNPNAHPFETFPNGNGIMQKQLTTLNGCFSLQTVGGLQREKRVNGENK